MRPAAGVRPGALLPCERTRPRLTQRCADQRRGAPSVCYPPKPFFGTGLHSSFQAASTGPKSHFSAEDVTHD